MSNDSPFEPQKAPRDRPGPEGGARARNRAARTRALCEAALGQFLERGVERVAIADITKAAGVSKGSFYRYFDDKTHLVQTLMSPVREALIPPMHEASVAIDHAQTDAALQSAYEALAAALVPVLLTHPGLVRLYLQERQGPPHDARAPFEELSAEITERAIAMTRAALDHGLLTSVDPRVSARVVLGAVYELLFAVLRGDDVGDPISVAQSVVDIVVKGVAAR